MRTTNLATAAALAATLLSACDGPGTAPPTSSNGSELILQNPTSGTTRGEGGPTTPDDPGPDPDSPRLLDTTDLLGPVSLPTGGSARLLSVFLETDRTVHVWATSDGTRSGTYDRQTNWTLGVLADTPLKLDWVRTGESTIRGSLWSSDSGRSWLVSMPTLATAHEFRVRGSKGTVVTFSVQASSGFRPANWEAGWSPTALSDAETTALLTMGLKQKPIGTHIFRIRLP